MPTIDDYLNITNAEEMKRAGVVPKTSAAHMALITEKRLETLRDKILSEINDEMLGEWYPAVEQITSISYRISKEVKVDDKLGHIVRLKQNCLDSEGKTIPAGTTGRLIGYSQNKDYVFFHPLKGKDFLLAIDSNLSRTLEASSLGQIEPKNKEDAVKEQVLEDFFPTTRVDTETAQSTLVALLMGKDMIFYGPYGSGKSQITTDLKTIASKSQQIIFTVDGCKVQCNPYSLIDEEFAKKVQPCPECMIEYDPNFKKTGFFKRPDPKNVKVTVAKYGEGHGIEQVDGTMSVQRMNLIGYKMPDFSGEEAKGVTNGYDPEGFEPGKLPRTNNGILHLEETGSLRPDALANLLACLNNNTVQPDQIRYSYPANNCSYCTTNEIIGLSPAFSDRVIFIPIKYPTDVDTSYDITRRAIHGETTKVEDVPIADTHRMAAESLTSIPMPVIIERAIDALYIKFRADYHGAGKTEISGSNRSKGDAEIAARALLKLDKIFYENTPEIANASYAVAGIEYALFSRMKEQDMASIDNTKKELSTWVEEEYAAALKSEEDTWWCETFKYIAVSATQIPEIESNFVQELAAYKENATASINAYKTVKNAYESKRESTQAAKIKYPLMNYLFKQQPGFSKISEGQLIELMQYLAESIKNTSCKI